MPGPLYPGIYSPSHCSEQSTYHINGKYLLHCQVFIASGFFLKMLSIVCFLYIIRCVFQAMIHFPFLFTHQSQQVANQAPNQH